MKKHFILAVGAVSLVSVSSLITWHIAQAVHGKTDRAEARDSSDGAHEHPRPLQAGGGAHRLSTAREPGPEGRTLSDSERASMTPETRTEFDFNRTTEIAAASGDYAPLSKFFDGLSQAQREQYFKRIPAVVFSKLGPSHDIREKLSLLEKVNTNSNNLENMRRSVFEFEAVERYQEMKSEGVLNNLKDEEFSSVCRKILSIRMGKAFEAVGDAGSESALRAAASAVAYSALAGGTLAGSKEIAALPPGIARDEAVAEMVLWLRQSGSEKEAQPWLESIQDEKAKTRAMGK